MTSLESTLLSRIVSELASSHALMNCLIKEFALPERCLSYAWPEDRRGIAPANYLGWLQDGGVPLLIAFPGDRQFFLVVDRQDELGSQRYLSDIYVRRGDHAWHCPDFAAFIDFLLEACEELAGAHNGELLQQVLQSQHLTAAIVDHVQVSRHPAPLSDYLASEQGLWFGHPNHPAPKARRWPEPLPAEAYAPELHTSTPMHVLEVPRAGLQVAGNGLSDAQVLQGFVDQAQAAPERARIVLHPVQAQLFLGDPRVRALVSQGVIRDLGASGALASPTASMRTWYRPGHAFFIKGSLNVRITNCVRKNAWYELQSTLIVDRLMQRLQGRVAGLDMVREPGALSWAPPAASAEDERWFREQTGAILRENFCLEHGADCCLLAGTLFARDTRLQPLLQDFLSRCGGQPVSDETRLAWFQDYQRLLLGPVLRLFFEHGVVLEPHLQNCVLVHDNGRPVRLLLRDFEGIKLTDTLGAEALDAHVQPRVRQSLLYSRDQGWRRIAYCLFVNNLAEAVLALSWERPHLAPRLWRQVEAELIAIRRDLQRAAPELDALIAGQPIPCKTNLKVRLAAQADRHAGYVQLPCPWGAEVRHG